MAIVERFYNNDRARDIRELLTTNFDNVARYIPNNFLILTTTEKQNLPDDYKTHFKLVFDKEDGRIYRWSDIKRNWEQYLLYAYDDYARDELTKLSDIAFVDVELGIDQDGNQDPYTFTFYTREFDDIDGETGTVTHHSRQAIDSVTLTAENIKFNDTNSVQTVIQQLLDDFSSLDGFVGNRDDILQNPDLTAKTICGAIKEINNKAIENKTRLDDIESGATKVPEAVHAERADLADVATMAKDSEMLGGELPSYYAAQVDLDEAVLDIEDSKKRISKNESDIIALQDRADGVDKNVSDLTTRIDNQDKKLDLMEATQTSQGKTIESLSSDMSNLKTQIGWEILLS